MAPRWLLLLLLWPSVAAAADQECRLFKLGFDAAIIECTLFDSTGAPWGFEYISLPLSWQFPGDASNATFTPPTRVNPEFPVRPIGHGVALTGGKVYSPPQRLQTPVADGRSPIVRQSDSPARAAKILNRSDPVSPNGELIETVTDLHLAGVGIDFDLTRTYRSGVYHFGPLGFSWDHSYNRRLRTDKACDGSVLYLDGALDEIQFAPDTPGSDPKVRHYLAPKGVGLDLTAYTVAVPSSSCIAQETTEWVLIDAQGLRWTFDVRGYPISVQDPSAHKMTFEWDRNLDRMIKVVDTTGRSIYFIHSSEQGYGLLRCVSLQPSCAQPMVSYEIFKDPLNDDFGDLLSVKNAVGKGPSYRYYRGAIKLAKSVANPFIDATCARFCDYDSSFGCPGDSTCQRSREFCDGLADHSRCTDWCQLVTQPSPAQKLICNNRCKPPAAGGESDIQGFCRHRYASRWPMCAATDCRATCRAHYQSIVGGSPKYSYGRSTDLEHNLIEARDGDGRLVLENVYGVDPTAPDFDKVIRQHWGTGWVGYEYHDMVIEGTWLHLPHPRPVFNPNLQVTARDSFVPPQVCSLAGKTADHAVVLSDLRGTTHINYFDGEWNLLREVNAASAEQSAYVYDARGHLAGVLSATGEQTCLVNDGWGRPVEITRVPAPGYPGEAGAKITKLRYDHTGALVERIDDPNGIGSRTLIPRDASSRILAVERTIDAQTVLLTRFDYASASDVHPYRVVDPSGATTRFDTLDPVLQLPRDQVVDSTGPSPIRSHSELDQFGHPTIASAVGGMSHALQYDAAGSLISWDRRKGPTDPWFHTTVTPDGDGRPRHVADSNRIRDAKYNLTGDLEYLREAPANANDHTAPRVTCHLVQPDGQLVATLHPEGNRTSYFYDRSDRLTSVKEGYETSARQTIEPWDRDCLLQTGRPATADDGLSPMEEVLQIRYLRGGFVKEVIGSGIRRRVTTDGHGRPIEIVDDTGRKIRRGFDLLDRVTWEAVYDASFRAPYRMPDMHDSGLSAMTEYHYDRIGRVRGVGRWKIETGTVLWRNTEYRDDERSVLVTESGVTTRYHSDGAGRILEVTLPNGAVVASLYGGNRVLRKIPTSGGLSLSIESYDATGSLSQVALPNGKQVFAEDHDVDGLPIRRRLEGGLDRRFEYDPFGRLKTDTQQLSTQPPDAAQRSYRWDRNDRLAQLGDATSGLTSFAYDGMDRVIRQRDPLTRDTRLTYSSGSDRLSTRRDPGGSRWRFEYDLAGRLTRELVQPAAGLGPDQDRSFSYDPLDQLLEAKRTGGAGTSVVTRRFDSLGNRTSETSSHSPVSISHAYSDDDRLRTTHIDNAEIIHRFDELGRLASVDVNGKLFARYSYAPASIGGPRSIDYAAGSRSLFGYDGRGRQIAIVVETQQGGQSQPQATLRNVLGPDGIVRQRQKWFSGGALTNDYFQVDGAGRLTAEGLGRTSQPLLPGEPDNAAVAPFINREYTLNREADRYNTTIAGVQHSYGFNVMHQLVSVDGVATEHDLDGNLKSVIESGIKKSYTYDPHRHPVSSASARYLYDALGRRVHERRGSADTTLVWDGLELIASGTNGALTLEVLGDDLDEHIGRIDALGTGSIRTHHQTPDRSLFAITDGASLSEAFSYTAFGEVSVTSKQGSSASSTTGARLLFQGQLHDPSDSTIMMRARSYSPTLGRFTSIDPIGLAGGANHYLFVLGNPLAFRDPSGLVPRSDRGQGIERLLSLRPRFSDLPGGEYIRINTLNDFLPGLVRASALASALRYLPQWIWKLAFGFSLTQIQSSDDAAGMFQSAGLGIVSFGFPPALRGGGANVPPGGGGNGFDVPGAKRELFLTNEKSLGTPAERAAEALARFQRGELSIPAGLTREHLINYRQLALDAISRAQRVSPRAYANAVAVQQPRIDLIDAILSSGGP